jgi:hypothetical protein
MTDPQRHFFVETHPGQGRRPLPAASPGIDIDRAMLKQWSRNKERAPR